jgi:hypothetical protein
MTAACWGLCTFWAWLRGSSYRPEQHYMRGGGRPPNLLRAPPLS